MGKSSIRIKTVEEFKQFCEDVYNAYPLSTLLEVLKDTDVLQMYGIKPRNLLITGTSGSGKSFVAKQIGARLNSRVIHLDSFGIQEDGKWYLEWLPDGKDVPTVFEGVGDNMRDVIRDTRVRRAIILIPTPIAFKVVMAAKAKEALTFPSVPQAWLEHWNSTAKMNVTRTSSFILDRVEHLTKIIEKAGCQVVHVINDTISDSKLSGIKGWESID